MSNELSFGNKIYAHLAEGITSSQTSIPIVPGEMGNLWMGFRPGTYLYLTIMNELGQLEIVKVTGITNNALTVARGQGGTSARAFQIGSPVSARAVADQLSYMIQAGQFRQGNYNPNNVLTGDFPGEKFWQSGPAADQKRWWINAYGNKWRLMTGDIYGAEYRDGEGFIIAPVGWEYVDDYSTGNGLLSICEYDGEIYTGSNDLGNLLWLNVNTLEEVAPYIFPVEGAQTFMKFSVDGKLHAAMPRRRIYQWNGVDAWVELYNGGGGYGYIGMVELGGKIYVSTGGDGQLIEYDASPTIVAPKYGNDGIQDLILLGGQIYAITYFTFGGTGGRLFKWNGVNAWTQVAGKYSDSRNCVCACVHGGEIYAAAYYSTYHLLKWNGVNAWDLISEAPYQILSLASDGSDLYALMSSTDQSLYRWDGAFFLELDIEGPSEPVGGPWTLNRMIVKDGYFYATGGYGIYRCPIPV